MRQGARLVGFVLAILERLVLIHVPSAMPHRQPLAA